MLLSRGERVELVRKRARPVHVEVCGRYFQERVLAHHRRPVGVDQVFGRFLVQRVDRTGLIHARVPVRLELPVVGPERRQLIILVQLVLAARRVVAQVRVERIGQAAVRIDDRIGRRRFDGGVVPVGAEPPQPILDERPARVGVEVVQLPQRGIGHALRLQIRGDVVAGEAIPIALAGDAPDRRTLERIAAGLRDDVDVRAATAADFGAHGCRVNRDFLGRSEVHVVHRAVVLGRVRRDAVVIQVVGWSAPWATMLVEVAAFNPPGSCRAIVMPGQHGGRSENRPGCRDVLENFLIEARADLGVLDVNGRRRAAHRHGLLQRRQLHRAVDGDRLAHRHHDAFAHERRKSGELELQRVGARVDRREAILPGGAGRCARGAHDRRAGERDRDAGQRAALIVSDLANQLAEHLARLCRGRNESDGEHDRQGSEGPKDRTCQDDLLVTKSRLRTLAKDTRLFHGIPIKVFRFRYSCSRDEYKDLDCDRARAGDFEVGYHFVRRLSWPEVRVNRLFAGLFVRSSSVLVSVDARSRVIPGRDRRRPLTKPVSQGGAGGGESQRIADY